MVKDALTLAGVIPDLKIDMATLFNYFIAVKSGYRNNPFHNFAHALMVVHYSFRYMMAMKLNEHLSKGDMLAIVIGALCHDVDHRGRNNAFESMTRSDLAIRYNDSSPLESHHSSQAFAIALSRTECDIFKHLEGQMFGLVRQRIIAGIMATDMKFHGEHVRLLQEFQLQPGVNGSQAQFLVEVLLHAADLSNPCMPTDVSQRWVKALHEEFTCQVQDERRMGLPVTSFMDGLTDSVVAAKSQIGFLDFVIHPLYDPIFNLFPGSELEEPKSNLEANRKACVEELEGRRREL